MIEYKPLRNMRVLDLTRAMAGPFCTMILGDLGADVIKVEPASGDMTRTYTPRAADGTSTYFLSANRSKRSISIDFRNPDGLRTLRLLAEQADIVVENFRPGVMDSIGLSYDSLAEGNPRLIMASISGFGRGGPYEEWPGFDQIAQGMSGLMSVTGTEEVGPVRVGIPITDLTTGMWTAIGILAAAFDRASSGVGRRVGLSLLGGALSLMTIHAQRYLSTGEIPVMCGNDHAMIAPYGVFEAKDGPLSIGAGTDAMWIAVAKVIDRPDLLVRTEYSTMEMRVKNRIALREELNQALRKADRQEWTARFIAAGVPAGPVWNLREAFADEHVNSSGRIVTVNHPIIGELKQVALPISFGESQGISMYDPPPILGQHSVAILKEYGIAEAEIARLRASGAILQADGIG